MFVEQVSDSLVFMDKVEDMAKADEKQRHWDEYNRLTGAGFKVVLVPGGEAKAQKAADDYKAKRAKRGSGKGRSKGHQGGDNKLTSFTMATELEEQHFSDWSDEELDTLDDPEAFFGVLLDRVEKAGAEVSDFYGIMHDKDAREVWSTAENAYVKEPKCLHAHIVCKFSGRGKGLTLDAIAKALGVETNMIEKPKSGRYSYDNMVAYLIHAKDRDKYQYPPEEVYTLKGTDYMDVWAEHKKAWERGSAVKEKKAAVESVDYLVDLARTGAVNRSQILLTDEYYSIYSIPSNKKQIDVALQAFAERRMAQAVADMDAGKYTTTIIFVYGKPGTGKSNVIKSLCRYWESVNGWQSIRLAASNAMDEYAGEEVIVLDDVRGGAMSAEDWLRLLDPYNANAASARYKNKAGVAPRVIIISSNKDPLEFFYYSRNIGGGDRSEMVDTFFRRLQWYVTVLNPFDAGMHNCIIKRPVRCDPYNTSFDDGEETKLLTGLTYRFEDAEADTRFSPFGLAEFIVRVVDSCSGGQISARPDAGNVFASVQELVYEGQLPAVRAGALPALPEPDGTTPQSVNLRSEYEAIFVPLWRDVFASELASGKKSEDAMASYEDWVEYGCCNSWDPEHSFFRALPSPAEPPLDEEGEGEADGGEVVPCEQGGEGVEGQPLASGLRADDDEGGRPDEAPACE